MIKLPCTPHALGAFTELRRQNVETMCTTVFSLGQACAVAQAGTTHILPFCEPVKELGGRSHQARPGVHRDLFRVVRAPIRNGGAGQVG